MDGLIHTLYTSFQVKDWKTMQSCYHDKATFNDPVFQDLTSREVKAMWHMLTSSAQDLKVVFDKVHTSGTEGSCDWQAWYTFSRTGRPVHNIIHARFEFLDGKIIRHDDSFNFWRWSSMALGTAGVLLGWSPVIRNKVRTTARKGLEKFMSAHPQYQTHEPPQ